MTSNMPAPFQQGELDTLCALYAIVNAVRLATPPNLRPSQHASKALFRALLKGLKCRRILFDALVDGISPEDMEDLLDDAAKWLTKAGMELSWWRPFAGMEAMRLEDWLAVVSNHLEAPGHGAITCIGGALNHWTALRGIGAGGLKLADSGGRQQLTLQACDTGLDGEGARYRLVPSELFLLAIAATP